MSPSKSQVLLIDDDENLRPFLALALSEQGYSVAEAPSAGKAKDWLGKHKPAAVVVDVMMPDLNGLDFCRWLRESPKFKRIPILVMSAVRDEETVSDALELGVSDFLRKPFELKELWDKLDRLLPRD